MSFPPQITAVLGTVTVAIQNNTSPADAPAPPQES